MEQHTLYLPSGQKITAGTVGQAAIREMRLTHCVASGQQALPGSVCSAMLECRLFDSEGLIGAGDRLTLYTGQKQTGVFYAEKPERISANCCALTAYDPISRLDREIGPLLDSLRWPVSLYTLAKETCAYCGVELATEQIPNGDYAVERFYRPGLSARGLMQWICQLSGRFCVANAEGKAELRWFAPADLEAGPEEQDGLSQKWQAGHLTLRLPETIAADGVISGQVSAAWEDSALALTVADGLPVEFYYEGGCVCSDYTVAAVDAVSLSLSGVTGQYPETGENVYAVSGNPLLGGATEARLQQLAKTLYEILQTVTYTPCTLRLRSDAPVEAGQILRFIRGKQTCCAYIMTSCRNAGSLELTSAGSPSLNSASSTVSRREEDAEGRLLELEIGVTGLYLENRQDREAASALMMTVDGIAGEVRAQNEALSRLEQTAKGFDLSVQTVTERLDSMEQEGVAKVTTRRRHYTFDDTGLHIRFDGEQMENSLDHTGMYVRRGGDTMLCATDAGVQAVDVTVGNYLQIGKHACIEDYGDDRTACFYME